MSRLTKILNKAVNSIKGGREGFCADYSHNYQTISTKFNPNDNKSWINIIELEEIIEHTQDKAILDYICSLFGVSWHQTTLTESCEKTASKLMFKEIGELVAQASQVDALAEMNVRDENKLLAEAAEAREALNNFISLIEQDLDRKFK